MKPHWHAFAYTGMSYRESEFRAGKAPKDYPPIEIKDWLHRRPGLHTFAEGEVAKALAWLERELNSPKCVPVDAEGFPVQVRLEYSRARLSEKTNRDVVYGYYSRAGLYVSRALIECDSIGCY
jgi:hypothetical protein